MVILETPRLTLRHLEPTDLNALFALYRDPEVREHFPDGTLTLEETADEIRWFSHGHPEFPHLGLWATVERTSGEFLGRCGLLPWHIEGQQEVELAYLIAKSRWGQGFATEASIAIKAYARDTLALRRLVCLPMPSNRASLRVAAKVGLSFERELNLEGILCHLYSCTLHSGN
jgi:RimJ/RimL family protein N-acetyltransferase